MHRFEGSDDSDNTDSPPTVPGAAEDGGGWLVRGRERAVTSAFGWAARFRGRDCENAVCGSPAFLLGDSGLKHRLVFCRVGAESP